MPFLRKQEPRKVRNNSTPAFAGVTNSELLAVPFRVGETSFKTLFLCYYSYGKISPFSPCLAVSFLIYKVTKYKLFGIVPSPPPSPLEGERGKVRSSQAVVKINISFV